MGRPRERGDRITSRTAQRVAALTGLPLPVARAATRAALLVVLEDLERAEQALDRADPDLGMACRVLRVRLSYGLDRLIGRCKGKGKGPRPT